MDPFRYPQFCPIARAAEILGHRWVLPILRELFVGPQRFSDLRRRLGNVSTSVLTERLAQLERQGVAARRELPAPAASVVYELTARGRALDAAFVELIRWGSGMLTAPLAGDHFEPDWLGLAARAFARKGPTPSLRFELVATGAGPDAVVQGHGGIGGTYVGPLGGEPIGLRVHGPAIVLLGYLAGKIAPESLADYPDVDIDGGAARVAELPHLFDVPARDPAVHDAPRITT